MGMIREVPNTQLVRKFIKYKYAGFEAVTEVHFKHSV
jgi:hypothetical protein